MARCKICNKEIKPSGDYSNSNYCSVQCEIADYMIDEFLEEFRNDKEVLASIKNYISNLRLSKISVLTDIDDISDQIYKQYRQDVDYKKSINMSIKVFKYNNIYEKLERSGTLKHYTCNFCGNTYQNINNGIISKFTETENTGYCIYSSCNEWSIVFRMFYDAFSDSMQHMLVLKNMEDFVRKKERIDTPDSMRFFQMMSDRGIEAGAFEKKVWNLAADECNANIRNCRVIRHSDNTVERAISKFLRSF